MKLAVDGAVEQYLAGVRAALADLPAAEVTEIVDDVRAHLADLRTELGDDADLAVLSGRLGTPEAYAAELRSAAGYPEAPAGDAAAGASRAVIAVLGLVVSTGFATFAGLSLFNGVGFGVLGLAAVTALLGLPAVLAGDPRMTAVAALPSVRRFSGRPDPESVAGRALAFVFSLQPAWWLVRAVVAAMLVGLVLGRGGSFEFTTITFVLVFGAISVWLGYRSRADRRWLWLVVPLNAFAAALVLTGWPGWASTAGYVNYGYGGEAVAAPYAYSPGLWQDGERQITDIRPVDATGRALEGVYLFDQDGRPIDTGDPCEGYNPYGSTGSAAPYPRGSAEYDPETGECTIVPAGPIVVAVPTTGPTTAPAEPLPPAEPPSASAVPPTAEVMPPPVTGEPVPSPAQPTG